MDGMEYVKSGDEPYMQMDRMKLRNYFPHEIEKLSVIKIAQTRTFDDIGYPVRGGLYDPLMGPFESRDRCETCNQYELHCPGHIGHIELDVPAFNPVLFSFTLNLLKGSCVHCHRFTCNVDAVPTKILQAQLRCFELGLPYLAADIAQQFKDRLGDTMEVAPMTVEEEAQHLGELDKVIAQMSGAPISLNNGALPTKNAVDMRREIVKQYCKDYLFKRRERCPMCKGRNGKMTNDGGRAVILNFASVKASKGKKANLFNADEFEVEASASESEDEEKKKDMESVGYGGIEVTEGSLDQQMVNVQMGKCDKLAWRAAEIREHFRLLYKNDGRILNKLFPMLTDKMAGDLCPLDGLFCEHVIVPPTKFRPIRLFKGQKYEDPQTVNLRRLLEASEVIKAIALIIKGETDNRIHELVAQRGVGKTINAKMHNAYLALQQRMNAIFDEELDKRTDGMNTPGIKQILEKKQGLFRMNMMGKRVNFACRSVITPDPYLDIDEIGIPEIFAKKLTFPEPVCLQNQPVLRELVKRGPKVHPGANYVVQPNKKKQILSDLFPEDKKIRRQLAESLSLGGHGNILRPPMKVLRHLRKGDMMMMNRQPSLHKPSIMGHRARILTGQRALRMNYAPCKAYNADFDGDEMNGHLVQTHIAQSEVHEIASVGSNLLVPKDATPLLGLIQDHVVSGVLLTVRGRFLNKEDFMHLVLAAFSETPERLEIPEPCMIKPRRLYSGKQVISTIIKNCIPKGQPLINLSGKAKTPLSCWKVRGFPTPELNMSESEVVFREGELLVGVLDKAHYGATQFGLAHCCFELYGNKVGVKILSCFSRLFTTYLQYHGFTLGVADILVRKDADKERKKAVMESRTIGEQVVKNAFGLDENASSKEIKHVLASTYCNPRGQGTDVKMLDYGMKQGVAKYNDAITKACVPEGLIRSFPENALQMMIQSGAKGSAVNAIQISCCLGQIELEGKRMATTVAGRTLPSFKAFDPSPRAGGYIDQRFLTGINPQELFFHTMAGREGLIDTAVKTSRSGYLQRCIIKHLEGIKVHYDATVRDHDGSIIQFRYGEDGLDTCKSTFLGPKTFKFLEDNLDVVKSKSRPEDVYDSDLKVDEAEHQFGKIKKWMKKNKNTSRKQYVSGFTQFANDHLGCSKDALVAMWHELDQKQRMEYEKMVPKKCPTAVDEKFNVNTTLGALPEKVLSQIDKYSTSAGDQEDNLRRTLFWKGMRCFADPGENVGLLAAQSIGEPSTQMTLNTFHFAGRGEMNVTLGIPRLREILMTASKNIATPSAQIAVIPGTPKEKIEKIKQQLDRVYLKQLLKKFSLEDRVNMSGQETWRRYTLRLEILDASKREQGAKYLKRSRIMREIETKFFRTVVDTVSRKLKIVQEYQQLQSKKLKTGNLAAGLGQEDLPSRRGPVDDGASSDEEADGGREADASEKKLYNRHNDEAADYEGEEEDRGAVEPTEPIEQQEETEDREVDEDAEGDAGAEKKEKAAKKQSPDDRIRFVVSLSEKIVGYEFDQNGDKWCKLTIQVPLTSKTKLDVATIVEKEIESFIVHQTPGIERCVESVQQKDGVDVTYIQTQGVNLQALFAHSDYLDVNSVYSNDLNLVLSQYGVEACAKAIVTEMNNVFAVYGIDVSKRHLTLTADYMTFTGVIAPFNRVAMASSASPLQKMTFETTIAFLRDSLMHGEDDVLNSPSSRLVVGNLNRGGTGAFDLLFNLDLEPESFGGKKKKSHF